MPSSHIDIVQHCHGKQLLDRWLASVLCVLHRAVNWVHEWWITFCKGAWIHAYIHTFACVLFKTVTSSCAWNDCSCLLKDVGKMVNIRAEDLFTVSGGCLLIERFAWKLCASLRCWRTQFVLRRRQVMATFCGSAQPEKLLLVSLVWHAAVPIASWDIYSDNKQTDCTSV